MVQVGGVFALTRGEFVMVAFLFVLVWGAGLLPRLGEWLGQRWGAAARGRRD